MSMEIEWRISETVVPENAKEREPTQNQNLPPKQYVYFIVGFLLKSIGSKFLVAMEMMTRLCSMLRKL